MRLKSAIIRVFGAVGLCRNVIDTSLASSLVAGINLPVYIDENQHPCFKLNHAPIPHRAFILTIPKSGTYLIAKILENLGIVDCGVHIAEDHIQDNRFADKKILRVEPVRYMVLIPLERSLPLINSGQFAFGHIPYSVRKEYLLYDFKKVFSFRNMRDTIISLVRYESSRKLNGLIGERLALYNEFKGMHMGIDKVKKWYLIWGKEVTNLIRCMTPWKGHTDVFQLKFEVLMGDEGREAQFSLLRDLGWFLGLSISDYQIEKALKESLNFETLTYSGKRSSFVEWWNEELEELFELYGYKEFNSLYGYE